MMANAEQRAETTLHVRNPQPGATYHVVIDLTLGISESPALIELREFDLLLEFRNPDTGDPGFGFGVDWDDIRRKKQGVAR